MKTFFCKFLLVFLFFDSRVTFATTELCVGYYHVSRTVLLEQLISIMGIPSDMLGDIAPDEKQIESVKRVMSRYRYNNAELKSLRTYLAQVSPSNVLMQGKVLGRSAIESLRLQIIPYLMQQNDLKSAGRDL